MNQSDFNAFVADFRAKSTDLLTLKGGEYAGSEDRLSNFKRGAAQTGATELQVCFQALSEPIQGRCHDAVNYLLLLAALIHEAEGPRQ